MIPGQTYVGVLPGDRRASIVRKRPVPYRERSTFSEILSHVFAPTQHAAIGTRSNRMRSWRRLGYYDSSYDYDDYPRRRRVYRPPRNAIPYDAGHGRVATTMQQTCSACGKFRSPSWQARHPLIPGDIPPPTICRSCRDKKSSSEESECFRRDRKRHKHRHYHCTDSDEEYVCEPVLPRRHSRHIHCHHPRALTPSPSRESVNIFIDNDSGARKPRAVIREPTESTEEEVEIVQKILPRKRSRSSIVIGEYEEPRLRRRRSMSSVSIVRSRSPRRTRFVDELDELPPRRRYRSGSRVSFTEEPDEIIVSRPRSTSRRRVFYDGADSGQSEALDGHTPAETPENTVKLPVDEILPSGRSLSADHSPEYTTRSHSRAGRASDPSPSHSAASFHRQRSISRNSSLRHTSPDEVLTSAGTPTPKPVRRTTETRRTRKLHPSRSPSVRSSSKGASSTGSNTSVRYTSYQHVPAPSRLRSTPQPDTAWEENVRPSTPILPSDPDHPDHLIWLLSSHHITPEHYTHSVCEYQEPCHSDDSQDATAPETPTGPQFPFTHRNAWGDDLGDGGQKYEGGWDGEHGFVRDMDEMDYDEAAYWEGKWRETSDAVSLQRRERERVRGQGVYA